MAIALLGATLWLQGTAAAQGLDAIVTPSAPDSRFLQGAYFQIGLSVAPPADAPGAMTATVDGIGTVDGFVQKLYPSEFDCPYGGCPSGTRPTRCAPGRQCFVHFMQLDVRAPLGRRDFAITVVDARGRPTQLSTSIDVQPALDDDRDGLPDVWESTYDLSFRPGVGGPNDDPDGDGVVNAEEFRRGTNPRARYVRYFAEGSSGDRAPGLEQCFVMASLSPSDFGGVWITVIGDNGRRRQLQGRGNNNRTTFCPLDRREHTADRVVAVLVEAQDPTVVERVAISGARGDGPTEVPFGTVGVAAPSSHWMFADGGTDGELDTFYLAYNPTPAPVEATFTYRTPAGAIVRRDTRTLPPGGRTTTWVNVDQPTLGRAEAWVDVTSTAPILVERAWRFDPPGRTVTQSTASPGTTDASSRWFFPEVDGDAGFETTLVLANPDSREARLYVNLLFSDREARGAGELRVPPGGRVRLPARAILPGDRASVEIVSLNGVRVLGERTLSGRDDGGHWRLATIGAREPGVRWALASVTGARDVVVTNVSSFPARVELHFSAAYSYSDDRIMTLDIPARRRAVVATGGDTLDTLRVTSQPTDRGAAEIVVDAERYTDIGTATRARSSAVAGLPVP